MSFDDLFIKDKCRLVLILSDSSQNSLPFVQHALNLSPRWVISLKLRFESHVVYRLASTSAILLTLTTPSSYFDAASLHNVRIIDWTENVPDFMSWSDPIDEVTRVLSTCLPTCHHLRFLRYAHNAMFRSSLNSRLSFFGYCGCLDTRLWIRCSVL